MTANRVEQSESAPQATAEARRDEASPPEPLYAVSHEMRTLLAGVLGCTGLLLDGELAAEQRDLVKRIRASGDALLALVNNVLDFSKADANLLAFEVTSFDLRRLVEEVGELMAERASAKGIELVVALGGDLPTSVKGDAGRIKQILLNLAANAIKFTDDGEVVVRVEPATSAGAVRFEVIDTGAGISEGGLAKLFRPFSQVDQGNERGGTGLGLALCKRLVEAMGGAIGVASELGRGSTFWFEVPFAAEAFPNERREIPRVDFAGQRVLLVVPNATTASVLVDIVSALEVEPTRVETPAEALKAMRAAQVDGRSFDLAVVDRRLPRASDQDAPFSGADLALAMQSEGLLARARIVLLAYPGERQSSDRDAAAVNLSKPVRRAHLHAALRTLMGSSVEQARIRSRAFAAPSPQEIEKARKAAAAASADRPRVLLVEDNLVNQRVSSVLVEKRGYKVDTAATGIEAVDAAIKVKYAAIFMDCQMPKLDGYGATAQIRRLEGESRRTPIIAMTANAHQGAREKCIAAGMDDYLSKPIVAAELDRVLRTWAPRETGTVVPPRNPSRAAMPAASSSAARPSSRPKRKSIRPSMRSGEIEATSTPPPPRRPSQVARAEADTVMPDARPRRAKAPAVDRPSLDRLRMLQSEGEPDIVREVVGLFLDELPARRTALATAAAAGDMRDLSRAAHTLKGSAANVGALPLADACGKLESRARYEETFDPTAELEAIIDELDRAVAALEALRGEP